MFLRTKLLTTEEYLKLEERLLKKLDGLEGIVEALRADGARPHVAESAGLYLLNATPKDHSLYPESVGMLEAVERFRRPSLDSIYPCSDDMEYYSDLAEKLLQKMSGFNFGFGMLRLNFFNETSPEIINNNHNRGENEAPYIRYRIRDGKVSFYVTTNFVVRSKYWSKRKKHLKSLEEKISSLPEQSHLFKNGKVSKDEKTKITQYLLKFPKKDDVDLELEIFRSLINHFKSEFKCCVMKTMFALNLNAWNDDTKYEEYLKWFESFPKDVKLWSLGSNPNFSFSGFEMFDLRNEFPKYPSIDYMGETIPLGTIVIGKKLVAFSKVFMPEGIRIMVSAVEGMLTAKSKILPDITKTLGAEMEFFTWKEYKKEVTESCNLIIS